jgi:hypothetical protein
MGSFLDFPYNSELENGYEFKKEGETSHKLRNRYTN